MICFLNLFLLLLLTSTATNVVLAADERPNIVVILADDFGVGDIQALYPKNVVSTPFLDRLVHQGMSFSDAHSPSAVCTPSRYGLLTGRYSWRSRLQEWVLAAYEPPLIQVNRPTLPRFLSDYGYETIGIGKWHLGWEWPGSQANRMVEDRTAQISLEWDFTKPVRGGPTERGFDYYFGTDVPNFPPFTFIENDTVVVQPTARYHDDSSGGMLSRVLDGAPMAPGWQFDEILPVITKRAVEQIRDRANRGRPFFLYFSMTSPHQPIAPSKSFRGKSGIAAIADFLMETDWAVGQVVSAIDEAGIADNTIVIFTADNGHSRYSGWEALVAAGHMPSGPYRGNKGDIWEGGHRVPFVVRWPGKVTPNVTNDQLVSLTDIFATCAEVIGADLPSNGAEDSISFLASLLLEERRAEGRSTLVNHSVNGEFAYRSGPWKLVFPMRGATLAESRGKRTGTELYNLESDISEQYDISQKHPARVQEMSYQLQQLITAGTSRPNQNAKNDTIVYYDITQRARWAPRAK